MNGIHLSLSSGLPPSRPRSSLAKWFGHGLGVPTAPGVGDAARKIMETCRSVDLRRNVCLCPCLCLSACMHAWMYVCLKRLYTGIFSNGHLCGNNNDKPCEIWGTFFWQTPNWQENVKTQTYLNRSRSGPTITWFGRNLGCPAQSFSSWSRDIIQATGSTLMSLIHELTVVFQGTFFENVGVNVCTRKNKILPFQTKLRLSFYRLRWDCFWGANNGTQCTIIILIMYSKTPLLIMYISRHPIEISILWKYRPISEWFGVSDLLASFCSSAAAFLAVFLGRNVRRAGKWNAGWMGGYQHAITICNKCPSCTVRCTTDDSWVDIPKITSKWHSLRCKMRVGTA